MQGPPSRSYQCEKHSDQKVMFVCAVNDWHFEPLCQLCTPGHTQNHAKRLKINLQAFEQINKKVMLRQQSVSQSYSNQVDRINKLLGNNNYEDLPIVKDLKLIQTKIIQKIKGYFSELNLKLIQKLKISLSQNSQKLKTLSLNLQNQIKCIKQITKPEITLETWRNSAKKIYFQEKLESYLEQSKQIIQEYEQRNGQITTVKRKQLFTDENKFLSSLITLINGEVKSLVGDNFLQQNTNTNGKMQQKNTKKSITEKTIPGEKDIAKKPILKPKRKLCKNCNEEMEYLTENKKHLICRYCNFKERNYIKKPN